MEVSFLSRWASQHDDDQVRLWGAVPGSQAVTGWTCIPSLDPKIAFAQQLVGVLPDDLTGPHLAFRPYASEVEFGLDYPSEQFVLQTFLDQGQLIFGS